jgi:hypothetical protein
MVRTVASKGPRVGKPLWRCSDYSCPILINIDDETVETPAAPVAGESAQARYERERKEAHARIRLGAPMLFGLGGLLSLMVFWAVSGILPRPYPELAAMVSVVVVIVLVARLAPEVMDWKHGAEAERRVGESLDALIPLGFVVLYDRSLRGRGGNIDAVAVGPPGVFVIESKWRKRAVEVINRRLEVGGRDQPDIVRQVTDLAFMVQLSVADWMNSRRLTVMPIFCIGNRSVDKGVRASGVPVLDAKSVGPYMTTLPKILDLDDVQELARRLDNALPPFSRRT